MSFISNVLDAIPVVGHVKAVVHYAAGDEEGGHRAMYQSTRTTAVLAGGAIGTIAGPGGSVAGATYAGCLTDFVASAASGKSKGIVKDLGNVAEDIRMGQDPTKSLLKTGAHVGMDAIGGLGMGGISSATAGSVSTKIAKDVGFEAVKKSGEISLKKTAGIFATKVVQNIAENAVEAQAILIGTHVGSRVLMEEDVEKIRYTDQQSYPRELPRVARDKLKAEIRHLLESSSEKSYSGESTSEGSNSYKCSSEDSNLYESSSEDSISYECSSEESISYECSSEDTVSYTCSSDDSVSIGCSSEEYYSEDENIEYNRGNESKRTVSQREGKNNAPKATGKENNGKSAESKGHSSTGFNHNNPKPSSSGQQSGGQPPKRNQNNKDSNNCNNSDAFTAFFILLKDIVEKVRKEENKNLISVIIEIFNKINDAQKEYLKTVIEKLTDLNAVLELVVKLFCQQFSSNINFTTFLSLIDFVQTYVSNEVVDLNRTSQGNPSTYSSRPLSQRRLELVNIIKSHPNILTNIFSTFVEIQEKIELENARVPFSPNFRDIFASVYHYFKHKIVPGSGNEISVKDYYYWIRNLLAKLKLLPEYTDNQNQNSEIVFQFYVAAFNKIFRIVVKIKNGKIVLSSAFFIDKKPNDKDKKGFVRKTFK